MLHWEVFVCLFVFSKHHSQCLRTKQNDKLSETNYKKKPQLIASHFRPSVSSAALATTTSTRRPTALRLTPCKSTTWPTTCKGAYDLKFHCSLQLIRNVSCLQPEGPRIAYRGECASIVIAQGVLQNSRRASSSRWHLRLIHNIRCIVPL